MPAAAVAEADPAALPAPLRALLARTGLNPEQRAAVLHPADGPALVIVAGAGTGKTLALTARLAALVAQGADPQRLLLVTFSRRAAAELAQRAGRLLHQAAGLGAATPPPVLPWCGTFHGIAARLLRELAPQIGLHGGFTVLDRDDAAELMAQQRQHLGLATGSGRHRFPLAETCVAIASRMVGSGAPLAEVLQRHFPWCARHEAALAALLDAFARAKASQQALDFDDLLRAWDALLRSPQHGPALRARWDHVLVDEVQDVNALQAGIVQALCPQGRGLTAVGDDAQAIYGFRGAEVRHLRTLAAGGTPPARLLKLEQNYRSTPALLAAANAVIALAEDAVPKRLWTARADGPRPTLRTVTDEAGEARAVADAVLAAREQGLALRRQAVLFRTATHAAALELELLRRGIPFVKYGGLRFVESAHVKDLLAVLRWADNPAAQLAAARVARRVPGLGPASVARLLAHRGPLEAFAPPPAAATGWAALLALMQRLRGPRSRWPDDVDAVIAWLEPHLQRLHADAEARLADLRLLARLAAGHAGRSAFVTELALDPPNASSLEAGPPLRDDDWLVLSTIHSAKGQEWSAVHVLHLVDGALPADMATGRADEIEEERRLLYVAMTRARDSLHLWVPQRFHVAQQRALGDAHVYALRSRFLPDALLPLFDTAGPEAERAEEAEGAGAVTADAAAGPPTAARDAAAAGSDTPPGAAAGAGSGAGFDLWGQLRAAPTAATHRG